jgi:Family of unknown function (DUF5871)
MSSAVVSPAKFDVSKITFSPVKTLESGGKQAYLNYEGRPLVMQVGPLETPFGMSVFDKAGPPKYSVDLKLRGYDDATNQPKTAAIYNALHGLDEKMLDEGVKNSTAWFKGSKSREVLSELYTPTVKFAKDAEGNLKPYPPTLKIQLRQRDGKFETAVYDDKKRPLTDIPLEDVLVKGAVLTALIQCTGVWFAGGKFGLSWKAIQIRADKVPDSIRGFAFLDEDGDAEEETPAPAPRKAAPAAKPATAPAPANSFAALHDDDEEVDDEEALAPPPAKPAAAAAPAPAAEEDEEPEEAPLPVPAKKTLTTKKIVAKAAKK